MDERNNHFDFDFTPIGQAIKKAREARGITREQLSGIIGYAPRHIQSIENEGQYPSIELFIQLITMFDVSVDEYIYKGLGGKPFFIIAAREVAAVALIAVEQGKPDSLFLVGG